LRLNLLTPSGLRVVLFQFLEPLGINLLVCIVWKVLVTGFSLAFFKAVSLGMPLVAGNNSRGIEGRGALDDFSGKKLLVDCFAVPGTDKVLIFYHRT